MPDAAVAPEKRKTVTVVFCDVTGSTSLGERLDPEALRRVMTRYFDAMSSAIEQHGGTVEKFIGDAVMAVFGIPTLHEDDAVRAVRAASGMRDALRVLNKELERDHGATLDCRIAVNTGEVVAGDATLRQALVTGDAVNVAARLEQAASPGEVLVSDATFRLVRDAVVAERVPPLDVKGKTEPVRAHRLIDVHPDAAGVARRLDSRLVGRARQLARIDEAFQDAVADRACHLLTLVGPPGVGKSRLLHEAIAGFGNATVLHGRCLSYGDGITYWPIAEIVRDALLQSSADGTEDIQRSLAALLAGDAAADDVAARIAALAGARDEIAVPASELAWAVRRFFESLAARAPLVVVVDDLHWASSTLLDLLDDVVELTRDAPILLACLARPELLEVRPEWGGGKMRSTTMPLEPLSSDETARLVENLLGGQVEESVRERVLQAAGGNPLFVEETIAMLVDEGSLERRGNEWRATTDLTAFAVPPTIHALLAARLDRLDDDERWVLGCASIAGQVFYVGAIGDVPSGREPTRSVIERLLRRDLVRPSTSDLAGQDAYAFHHVLLRDAAYAMLPKQTRAELHEAFGDWLVTIGGDVETDEFVGHHLERAYAYRIEIGPEDDRTRALASRAADRLSSAGKRAANLGDADGAIALFERAAELRGDDPRGQATDLFAAGWEHLDRERGAEALTTFERCLEAARAAGDALLVARDDMGVAAARWLVEPEGGSDGMRQAVDRALPVFEERADDGGRAIAALWLSQVEWNACRYGASRDLATEAVVAARRASDDVIERWAIVHKAASGMLGPTPALELRNDVRDVDRESDRFPSVRTIARAVEAHVDAIEGRFDEARAARERGDAIAREFFGELPSGGYEMRWRIEMLAGNVADAEAAIRTSYERLATRSDLAHYSTQAVELALACVRLGRLDEARRLAEECRTTTASDDVVNQELWRRVAAEIAVAEGDLDTAIRLLEEATEWVEPTDMLLDIAEIHLELGAAYALAGRGDDAAQALARARDAAERKGATILVERVDRERGRLDSRRADGSASGPMPLI